jgi:hypothetical protein
MVPAIGSDAVGQSRVRQDGGNDRVIADRIVVAHGTRTFPNINLPSIGQKGR